MYIVCHACDEEYQARTDQHCPYCGSNDSVNYESWKEYF